MSPPAETPRTRVIVAGGGTAGWLCAYALARRLGRLVEITLVESTEIGTIGVGEATIPTMKAFHDLVGIDERAFMAATGATFKLGIVFDGWAQPDDSYIHSFGTVGESSWMAGFHAYWADLAARGQGGELADYCLEWLAAREGRFATAVGQQPLNYAYHLDAGAYAAFLRAESERLGVTRIDGRIERVECAPSGEAIRALHLADGQMLAGDLFLDCTGGRALLIGQALGVGYEDWSHLLAADSAWAVPSAVMDAPPPYTRAIAHRAGWQWQIPLRTRTGNGLVYASRFCSDDEARATLLANLCGEPLAEPRLLRFATGRRMEAWRGNCVAIGLSSGFVEPLESTSIHLITTALIRLMRLFPFGGQATQPLADRYNAETREELEEVRDFILLHYGLTQREDDGHWSFYRTLEAPTTLDQRIALFRSHGYVWPDRVNLFRTDSWLQVMLGQGIKPERHHAAPLLAGPERLQPQLRALRERIARQLAQLPAHGTFLQTYCPLPPTTTRHGQPAPAAA